VHRGSGTVAGYRRTDTEELIKAHKAGKLTANGRGSKLTAERIEIRQLRAEVARLKVDRDIQGKAAAYFSRGQR
jgi:transposase